MIDLAIVSVPRHGRRLVLRTPYKLKDICKALPGARWHPGLRVWHVPATPAGAVAAVSALGDHGAVIPPDVQELIERGGQAEHLRKLSPKDFEPILLTAGGEPWHHQLRGFNLICKQEATMLAWDMGTGKSRSVIDVVQNLDLRHVLIVCPASVVAVWPAQFAKHCVKQVLCLPFRDGPVKKRTAQIRQALIQADVRSVIIVVNYEAVYREPLAKLLLEVPWDLMVADESHRIKAPRGVQSLFVAKLGRNAKRRVCLTGTPMPHGPLDVFAQYRFLDSGVYGTSFTAFRAKYAIMGGYENHEILGFQHLNELNRLFFSIGDRVTKDQVLDLPSAVHEERTFALSKSARRIYDDLSSKLAADVSGNVVTAANVLARIVRLQQVTSGYLPVQVKDRLTDGPDDFTVDMGKRDVLRDLLANDLAGERVVVFCRFKYDLQAVQTIAIALHRECHELSGRVNEIGPVWEPTTDNAIAAVQIHSGGVGIDLCAACYAVHYSVGFDRGDYEQSLARLHRQGQTRSVTYFRLVAEDTIDARIYAVLQTRGDVVKALLGDFGLAGQSKGDKKTTEKSQNNS